MKRKVKKKKRIKRDKPQHTLTLFFPFPSLGTQRGPASLAGRPCRHLTARGQPRHGGWLHRVILGLDILSVCQILFWTQNNPYRSWRHDRTGRSLVRSAPQSQRGSPPPVTRTTTTADDGEENGTSADLAGVLQLFLGVSG